MRVIFQKKGKKKAWKGKIFENLGKNVQNLKIYGKGAASINARMKQLEYALFLQMKSYLPQNFNNDGIATNASEMG